MKMNCPKCGSEKFKLENKSNEPILEARQVALICADCGRWIKWCPKEERIQYIETEMTIEQKLMWLVKHDFYIVPPTIDDDGENGTIFRCDPDKHFHYGAFKKDKTLIEAIESAYKWATEAKQ